MNNSPYFFANLVLIIFASLRLERSGRDSIRHNLLTVGSAEFPILTAIGHDIVLSEGFVFGCAFARYNSAVYSGCIQRTSSIRRPFM